MQSVRPSIEMDELSVSSMREMLENSCGTADRMLGGGDAKYMWCQDVGLSEIAERRRSS